MSTSRIQSATHQELADRISGYRFDLEGTSLTFERKLARENGWSAAYTRQVVDEYRKFMFLAVVAGHQVAPSDQVDQVWHMHLGYTRSYFGEWSERVLGTTVHHGPSRGGRAENRKHLDMYEATLSSYRKHFGHEPPADVWPPASTRFGDDLAFRRVNVRRNWVIPKPTAFGVGSIAGGLAVPIVIAAGGSSILGAGIAFGWIVVLIILGMCIAVEGIRRLSSQGGRRGRRSQRGTETSDGSSWGFGYLGGYGLLGGGDHHSHRSESGCSADVGPDGEGGPDDGDGRGGDDGGSDNGAGDDGGSDDGGGDDGGGCGGGCSGGE